MPATPPVDRHSHRPRLAQPTRVMLVLLPVLAALGPYASLHPIEGSPYYAFRALCIVALVPAIIAWARLRAVGSPATRAFAVLIGAWAVWAPAGLLWSQNPGVASGEVLAISVALTGSFAAVYFSAGTASGLRALQLGWITAFVITGGYACWELSTGNHLAGNASLGLHSGLYASSTFFNTNDYAGFLLACLPFLAGAAAQARSASGRSFCILLLVTWVLLAFATQSRTAILGALCAIPLLTYWYVKGSVLHRPAKSFLLARVGALTVVLVAAAALSPIGPKVLSHLESMFAYGGSTSRSDQTRFHLTRLGWKLFVESGLIGRGAGTFETAVAADPSTMYYAQVTNAHNGFIEIAAQYGVVVVVPLLFAFWTVIRSVFRKVADRKKTVLMHHRMTVLLGAMAFTASSLASSSVIASPWWWVLFGSLVAQSWMLHNVGRA
jgi:hypothetical protein